MQKRRVRRGVVYVVALALSSIGLVALPAGALAGAPSAPRAVHASGTATTISVRWAKPATTGATAIHEYVVTSHPSSKSCTTRTTTCAVKGLTPGKSYTFSVVAKNAEGNSAPGTSNRVSVAKASSYFLSALTTFENSSETAETAFGNATTTGEATKALDEIANTFATFIASLSIEQWSPSTRSDIASVISDTKTLGVDTVNDLASTSANEAENNDALQGASNKAILAEAKVFSDLGLTAPIVPSQATTPTPVSLDTPQTIVDFFGDQLTVTATGIIDPATAAPGSGLPDAGFRFVAVEFDIANASQNTIGGDANFSATATGSDGTTYSADYGTVSECSNFIDGDFEVPPSDTASGCVVFEVPTSVSVQSVQFSLAPGYLDTAEWSS